MRILALSLLLAAGAFAQDSCPAQGGSDSAACPPAQQQNPNLLHKVPGVRGFKAKLHCPPGFKAEAAANSLRGFRCVPGEAEGSELRSALNAPEQAPLPSRASLLPAAGGFRRYHGGREIDFDVPADWHVEDGWRDEPPTIYIVRQAEEAGKKASLLITKNRVGAPGALDLKAAIARDKEDQNAMEGGAGRVGGKPARFLYVPHESHTAYVEAGPGLYYSLTYSAPESLEKKYRPVYDRLLKSFRIRAGAEEP